jgi:hypothetical protein
LPLSQAFHPERRHEAVRDFLIALESFPNPSFYHNPTGRDGFKSVRLIALREGNGNRTPSIPAFESLAFKKRRLEAGQDQIVAK